MRNKTSPVSSSKNDPTRSAASATLSRPTWLENRERLEKTRKASVAALTAEVGNAVAEAMQHPEIDATFEIYDRSDAEILAEAVKLLAIVARSRACGRNEKHELLKLDRGGQALKLVWCQRGSEAALRMEQDFPLAEARLDLNATLKLVEQVRKARTAIAERRPDRHPTSGAFPGRFVASGISWRFAGDGGLVFLNVDGDPTCSWTQFMISVADFERFADAIERAAGLAIEYVRKSMLDADELDVEFWPELDQATEPVGKTEIRKRLSPPRRIYGHNFNSLAPRPEGVLRMSDLLGEDGVEKKRSRARRARR